MRKPSVRPGHRRGGRERTHASGVSPAGWVILRTPIALTSAEAPRLGRCIAPGAFGLPGRALRPPITQCTTRKAVDRSARSPERSMGTGASLFRCRYTCHSIPVTAGAIPAPLRFAREFRYFPSSLTTVEGLPLFQGGAPYLAVENGGGALMRLS